MNKHATLTNEQIAAGAAVLSDDTGKPIGRNVAIMVHDAMIAASGDAGEVASIDTPEFRGLLGDMIDAYRKEMQGGPALPYEKARVLFIAYIDAQLARQQHSAEAETWIADLPRYTGYQIGHVAGLRNTHFVELSEVERRAPTTSTVSASGALVHVGTLSVFLDKDASFGYAYDISTNMAGHELLRTLDGVELYAAKWGALATADDVRDAALEEAKKRCIAERDEFREQAAKNNGRESDFAFGSVNSAERIWTAIDTLKRTATAARAESAQPAAPAHETIVQEGGNLVCTACGNTAVICERKLSEEHPNLKIPIDPACSAKLNDLGDDRGQGLDPYWKFGFRTGWHYAKLGAALTPASGSTACASRAGDGCCDVAASRCGKHA